MARDELDLSDYRPSRVPRVLMIMSALAIMLVAAWFFSPILLAGYARATATALFGPKTAHVEHRQAPVAVAAAPAPTAPAAPAEDAAAPTVTAADNASAPAAPRPTENNAAAPWPTAEPNGWPQDQTASVAPAAPPPEPSAAAAAPPPAAPAETMQLASAAPTATSVDAAPNADAAAPADLPANVPLPRSRPSRQIAARLAIPLPRPRPDIDGSNVQTPEMKAFDLQVERMR
jgi:hypothetical protein